MTAPNPERLRELLAVTRYRATGDYCYPSEEDADGCFVLYDDYAALLHQLAERDAEVERLRRECDLRKHAVDRWAPCPDHRDKVDGRCYVCAKEAAERARDEATGLLRLIDDKVPHSLLGDEVTEKLAAFLAASGGEDNARG